MIDLNDALVKVKQIAVEVGSLQKANLGRKNLVITTKSTGIDLVTEIDQQSEQAIVSFLTTYYPSHAILAEETGLSAKTSDYLWIIDPLDGTTNYSQGLPVFAVSIALQYRGECVLGVVYSPATEQLFWAVRGQGAYLNGERLKVSDKVQLGDSVLATGFPYDVAEHPANNLCYFNELIVKTRAIRRLGAAAYDLACVAAGKFDGYWELNLSLWDIAAGILLVQEAGGKVVYFRNDRKYSLIAANEALCGNIQEEIRQIDLSRESRNGQD